MNSNKRQSGVASLVVVMFTAMIVVLITVSFVRIMLSDQQQASVNDLSQSAYDSAQAGVEDAKRAIIRYQNICNTGVPGVCSAAFDQTVKDVCNEANSLVTSASSISRDITGKIKEIKVQTGSANKLDQAYTCVKILLDTNDYIGDLKQDDSKFIPLVGTHTFNTVKIEWFNASDMQSSITSVNVPSPPGAGTLPLLGQSSWTTTVAPNRPPIMRAQLVQYNNTGGFTLSDLDNNTASKAYSSTMFLYPSTVVGASTFTTARRMQTFSPTNAKCNSSLASGGYACSATLILPMSVAANDKTAFLNIKALYKKTHYRITLLNGGALVQFHAIQPEIDSTGRANDLFRRVDSRVELGDITFPFPDAAVDLSNNFCKNFMVSDSTGDYETNCSY